MRSPEHLRLVNEATGEAVRVRCRATNRCPYCARLFAVETSEMLMLDAMEHAPSVYVVLTARELLDRAVCRRHLTQLRRSLRKRWPGIEWAVIVEFQRRGALHLNLLVKGVPAAEVDELRDRAVKLWCSRVDAEPQGQFVGEISEAGGLVRYIALHFLKESQAPPLGWRSHRFSCTRGYLVRPASAMRAEARRALRLKRLIWRGVPGDLAVLALEVAESQTWVLRGIRPGLPPRPGEGRANRDGALVDRFPSTAAGRFPGFRPDAAGAASGDVRDALWLELSGPSGGWGVCDPPEVPDPRYGAPVPVAVGLRGG